MIKRAKYPAPFLLLALSASGALVSCAQNQHHSLPQDLLPSTWNATPSETLIPSATTNSLAALANEPDLQSWWKVFNDPLLDNLVQRVVSNNLSLAQARERIQRTRLLVDHAPDQFLPELHARAQPLESVGARDTYFQYGLDASWELGLFGRREGAIQQAQAQLLGSQAEQQAIQVSVIAEVVKLYLALRTFQQQQLKVNAQLQLADQQTTLLEKRLQLGLSNQLELTQLRQERNQLSIAGVTYSQQAKASAQGLAILVGLAQPEADWWQPAAQPTLANHSFTGLPKDLLRTRPDIKGEEAKVQQALGELGVTRAEMYPYIALVGTFVYSVNLTQNRSLDGTIHSTPAIGPVIDIPLFDWGRRRAATEAQHYAVDEALLAYREKVLTAYAESQVALNNLAAQSELREHTADNLQALHKLHQRTETLVRLGLASPLDQLAQQQQIAEAERALLEANASHQLAFVALYKSLGGGALLGHASLAEAH